MKKLKTENESYREGRSRFSFFSSSRSLILLLMYYSTFEYLFDITTKPKSEEIDVPRTQRVAKRSFDFGRIF